MRTHSVRGKLKQILRAYSDRQGVTLLKKQISRATLTAVLIGGFIMEIVKTGLPILFGAQEDHAGAKLIAWTSGLTAVIGINLIYDRLGNWIHRIEELEEELEKEIVQEEQDIEETVQDINQQLERKVGKN